MIHPIVKTEKLSVSADAASSLEVNYSAFLIQNNSSSATVYFGEGSETAVTAESGFALSPGETLALPLCCKTLSLVASSEADVRLLYIGEGW